MQRKFFNGLILILILMVIFGATPGFAQGGDTVTSPSMQVKETLDKMVTIVAAYPGEGNTVERRRQLRELISPRFDFSAMAKSSLGPHWDKVTVEERTEFVNVFSNLLASTYLKRIENIRSDTVKIDGERMGTPPTTGLVKTTVTYKGDKFPIDYKLYRVADSWKVYDVIIENIGLVLNYRNEFAGIIRKEQFSGLMKQLRKKAAAD